jgi:type I restriction enzyme S subunit
MSSGDVHKRRIEAVDGRITEAGLASSNATLVDPPSVAVALAGQGKTRGAAALVGIRLCTNQSVALIKGRNGSLDASFLFYELDRRYQELRARSSGGGRAGLSRMVLAQVPLQIPPILEQRRIAEILDSVDEAILGTKQLIAKLQQIRQGLFHDLLTRGIDESGELRDPERHPEQFMNSKVGRVPTAWRIARLVDIVVLPSGQLDPRLQPYRSWPLVAPDHIESGTGRLLAKVTAASQGAISGKYAFRAGDVLYSKIRPYLRKATLADFEGLCSADMYPLRPGGQVRSRFLLAVILGEDFSRFAESVSMRSGFPKINREELGEYSLGLPELAEQERLGQLLSTFDDRMAHEEFLLSKLGLLRQGLTEALLTGRVRVTKLLDGDAA